MGKLNPFKSKKPDTSALEAQEKRVAEQEAKLKRDELEQDKKRQSELKARKGRQGARSLLSGLETGVKPVDETKRPNLG